MLGAFRVRGITPRPTTRYSKETFFHHPITGAKLSDDEGLVQFPRKVYDKLVAEHPEARLKYIDEEKEEIIVSSP
jgi:hypothetical protein